MAQNIVDHALKKEIEEKASHLTYQHKRLVLNKLRLLASVDSKKFEEKKDELLSFVLDCQNFIENKKQNAPKLTYDDNLPVCAKREDIIKAIKENQVVIIAGETGSGKTTQIPKMCIEAGLGLKGIIGHTQPRRIAARAVANRIAEEMNEPLSKSVGYKVRFTDITSDLSYIKLMTDGILLSETQNDRLLLNYDCIIIDEAHERSLNIDFLLGYLKNLLAKRPNLKLIITSATIDPERFSKHFNNAPIIEVSGRTYPVEVVYMPLVREKEDVDDELSDEEIDLKQGILKALHFLMKKERGDVLIFLSGERDIMEMSAFLKKQNLRDTEILPLYARLATQEQNKIFTEHTGVRIVLSTNVAETSLTVPSIKYVIDPGLARISRYSAKTKIQRLPIEPISQASANQRKGRCGRVSDGICVRLYTEDDFNSRPLYTDPEILRTNLAAVILQMLSLKLGDITLFPFIDAPTDRQISDGIRLLEELGAIKNSRNLNTSEIELTHIGTLLSKLPLDPRLARMVIEASKNQCLHEVMIIASALAVMDVRERPLDKKEASENYHSRFNDDKSEFISYLKLYDYLTSLQKELSQSAFKRQIKKEFISYLRVREWFDVLRQLKATISMMNFRVNEIESDYESIHKSILSGLLSHIAMVDVKNNGYIGARFIKFLIPKSTKIKGKPKWICAFEISETTRLFARCVASIEPQWLENLAPHLIKKTYNEPHWSKKNGSVQAYMTINLYGLPIVQSKLVQYSNIDKVLCRSLLIKEGLVGGDVICKHKFFKDNLALIDEVLSIEDRTRRRDLLVDDQTLIDFYDKRLPEDIVTMQHFDKWWRIKQREDSKYLNFSLELIAKDDVFNDIENDYPESFDLGSFKLKLSYIFDIKDKRDGVSVHIPLTVINQVKEDIFSWQIPALRFELVCELIRSLPKKFRRSLIPAPDYARAFLESAKVYEGNMLEVAALKFTKMAGMVITVDDFDLSNIPSYLFVNYVVEDLDGREIDSSKSLKTLALSLQDKAQNALQNVVKQHKSIEPSNEWKYGLIKREQKTKQGSLEIISYPALSVKNDLVTLELFDNKKIQEINMKKGLVHLLALSIKDPTSYLESHLPNKAKLSMYYQAFGSVKNLIDDLVRASICNIIEKNGGLIWSESEFNNLKEIVRGELNDTALSLAKIVEDILYKAHDIKRALKKNMSFEVAMSYKDISSQLDNLVYKGFISETSLDNLQNIPRYLQASLDRLNKIHRDIQRDLVYMRKVEVVINTYKGAITRYLKNMAPNELLDVKWMIEELRVSYFSQQLGVNGPISDKRILNYINDILKENPPSL